jgi:hypothetical protein
MTTGSWSTGPTSDLANSGFQAGKRWSGLDGRYVVNAGSRQSKWNRLDMTHRTVRIPSKVSVGTLYTQVGTNSLPGDPPGTNYGSEALWAAVSQMAAGTSIPLPTAGLVFDSYWNNPLEYKLLAKLIKKVKGHSYNVGVSLAEVDKFSSGVVSTVKQLGFGAADLASGRFESFARRFGTYPPKSGITRKLRVSDISGRFLEMRYAWTPAIQDIFAASEAFEALSNGPRKQIIRAGQQFATTKDYVGTWVDGTTSLVIRRSYTYEAYEELGALRQMGLGNPASILWERIPYSFVLDWFIPIGTYLELIGQVPYLVGRFQRNDYVEETYDGNYRIHPPVGGRYATAIPRCVSRVQMVRRTTPSSLSVPPPTLVVHGAVQGKRLQNAIALSHQVFIAAGVFLAGKARLSKGKIQFEDDGLNKSLLLKLGRI